MTIDEFIDSVNMELTAACTLPSMLPTMEIRRIVTISMRWFYKYCRFATMENNWFVPYEAMADETSNSVLGAAPMGSPPATRLSKVVNMPCQVQNIYQAWRVNRQDLIRIGIYAPSLNIGLGITGQPYLVSYVSTIAELQTYKSVIESFSAMSDKFHRLSAQFDFVPETHKLRILGQLESGQGLVLRTADNIPAESLFENVDFYEYVVANCMYQMGYIMGRYSFQLPGGVQYNADTVMSEGKERMAAIKTKFAEMTTTDFFYMRK